MKLPYQTLEPHEFVSQGKRNFLGIIEGVSDSGKLCVKIDGLSEKFDAKSIKMLY